VLLRGQTPDWLCVFAQEKFSVGRESQRFIVGHKAIPVTRP
jgi:hypothetical protein